ncbi:MAG: hypothetical protein A2W52_03425 [Candidatus Taylorbacteria bacterium RIFCSPHIGHO2_02_49_25]|uniref:Uncharacterized protein n=1 Tax=Candidatus Taylorbacteria bacterium RIFCSPHIGHO2_02_49_25 TaxID=1802305 RepID=A0A1G2MIB1_9BACT|nr:MAG: hypothetical protein A2W52_03425 [Candidatus Taylorbacteria bacterium RIFCSPHIGHO2_02_49_25]OHA36494.1 MAG: hypothetical protein A2W65_01225 [Candidatus Taylorbacteria bacterium RIFCSPLOWO2_02_50_13]OHA48076.1 MAG: hypothetical protein A3G61_00385 [Candidatus Taylorbacteria bacterium RIFCSPLOWO2_12_FULL_49_67]HCB35821.1 hypothetical protein [Candidatus Taylorbacteria bacterium]
MQIFCFRLGNDLKFYYEVYLKVHVLPEATEEFVTERGDILYVSVREKAERGAANRRMLELLRAYFSAHSRFRIISGHHSPHKIISAD